MSWTLPASQSDGLSLCAAWAMGSQGSTGQLSREDQCGGEAEAGRGKEPAWTSIHRDAWWAQSIWVWETQVQLMGRGLEGPEHWIQRLSPPGQLWAPAWQLGSHSTHNRGQRLTRKALFSKWVKVTQSCLTLCNPMDYTVHGILQARILEWVAFPFSRVSSQPRDWTQVSHIAGGFFTGRAIGKTKNTGVGSLSLLQQIFPTQESNQGLPHCRWSLYQLSYEGSPL